MNRLLFALPLVLTLGPAVAAPAPAYHLAKNVSVPGDGGWDYLTVDEGARRLYIARSSHVSVVNIDTGQVVGDIPDLAGVHGVAVDTADGRGFTSNGRDNSVTIFDLKTLKKIGTVPVGVGPDTIIFDPPTKRVFTFNGRGQSATAIDAVSGRVAGTVPLPGHPEFAVSDGRGHIFNNIEDKGEIADINARTLKVEHAWPLAPGEGPSGLAMDTKHRRLFAVCDNQKMVVLDADSGRVAATPAIGNGPDACAFDVKSQIVFSSNGQDGTLTVLREIGPDQYQAVGTVTTQPGARTMALDPKTHRVLTVAAKALPAAPGAGPPWRRSYVPGSFVVLEYGP